MRRYPDKERWRPVVGFEGLYEVSSHGRLRSVTRTKVYTVNGQTRTRVWEGVMHNGMADNDGYIKACLAKDGRKHYSGIHRLVARAFIGEPPGSDYIVRHKDDTPDNNHWRNLRWGLPQDNSDDMTSKQRQARGQRIQTAVLDEKKVKKIVKRLEAGLTLKAIGEEFGVSLSTIYVIKAGIVWSHVTGIPKRDPSSKKRKKHDV